VVRSGRASDDRSLEGTRIAVADADNVPSAVSGAVNGIRIFTDPKEINGLGDHVRRRRIEVGLLQSDVATQSWETFHCLPNFG
jgi:hypothetical protein